MKVENKVLLIPKIENGVVIDHIPTGQGAKILELLRSHDALHDVTVALGIHLRSEKIDYKDVLKLWRDDLDEHILAHIALVAPGATIKRVRDYKVDKKYVIRLPERLDNLVRCLNPNCMTNVEPAVATRFDCVDADAHRFRCAYCERVFVLERLERVKPSRLAEVHG